MNELSASESLFTSGQAARLGIAAKALSQAVASGRAERIAHGAYRLAGTPATELDRVAAIWKLTALVFRQPLVSQNSIRSFHTSA